jgi:RNA polymerase sigma-70 factor (ECF subfamily)
MNARYKTYSDRQLAELLNERDKYAYTEIYNRYWGFVYNHARRMTKDNDLAKDVLQDVFTNIYLKMGVADFQQIVLPTYLFTLVKHRVINLVNRDKLKINHLASLQRYLDQGENAIDNFILEKETQERIEKEIAALPKKMKVIFELSRKYYLTHKQIAEAVSISELTVKKQISNAISILRSRLSCVTLLQLMSAMLWLYRQG